MFIYLLEERLGTFQKSGYKVLFPWSLNFLTASVLTWVALRNYKKPLLHSVFIISGETSNKSFSGSDLILRHQIFAVGSKEIALENSKRLLRGLLFLFFYKTYFSSDFRYKLFIRAFLWSIPSFTKKIFCEDFRWKILKTFFGVTSFIMSHEKTFNPTSVIKIWKNVFWGNFHHQVTQKLCSLESVGKKSSKKTSIHINLNCLHKFVKKLISFRLHPAWRHSHTPQKLVRSFPFPISPLSL